MARRSSAPTTSIGQSTPFDFQSNLANAGHIFRLASVPRCSEPALTKVRKDDAELSAEAHENVLVQEGKLAEHEHHQQRAN
jgi:hypothetical protein